MQSPTDNDQHSEPQGTQTIMPNIRIPQRKKLKRKDIISLDETSSILDNFDFPPAPAKEYAIHYRYREDVEEKPGESGCEYGTYCEGLNQSQIISEIVKTSGLQLV
jgi:rhodanese-related sulfurtransferase